MTQIDPKAVNRWTARFMPAVLIGAVTYATYVLVVRLCINYLYYGVERRTGAAIAILTTYSVLLLLIATAYFRLLYIVSFDPGFVPLGPAAKRRGTQQQRKGAQDGAAADTFSREYNHLEAAYGRDMSADSPGLEEFYTRNVFVSESDGRPRYCNECATWRPDRSHHCSDVGRCVRKMDHFCPWVGGVVGENSYKFFVQFVLYTFAYCVLLLIVMAYYMSDQINTPGLSWDKHFAAVIGLSVFFGLFTGGISSSSIYFVIANLTTVENLNKNTKVWQLAVFLPNHQPQSGIMDTSGVLSGSEYPTIKYPLPVMSEKSPQNSAHSTDTDTNSTGNPHSARDSKAVRTFALLRMGPGQSPWDLGAAGNWKTVMGNNIIDWLLPIKRSPCCNHESTESQFPVGRWVEHLKVDYGLMPESEIRKPPPFSGRAYAKGPPRKPDDTQV